MKILVMTNTFSPHVGGVARSVESFVKQYRSFGHEVLIVAPDNHAIKEAESGILRVPAIENFNGTGFSVALPLTMPIITRVEEFKPDLIHTHHPFILGSTGLRIAHAYRIPLVFTHHTKYEDYTHNMPGDSDVMKRFSIKLATNYANLCDHVIAPSQSLADLITERGVTTPISVIPTGVDLNQFRRDCGIKLRTQLGIPDNSFVIGHVGRLSKEKNLEFIANVAINFIKHNNTKQKSYFLLVGDGPERKNIEELFMQHGLSENLYMTGILENQDLANAYKSMDVFIFASKTETQGIVLIEAMSAGVPVISIDAPGARDVIIDYVNGRLLDNPTVDTFSSAVSWVSDLSADKRQELEKSLTNTAENFSMIACAQKAINVYEKLCNSATYQREPDYDTWTLSIRTLESEFTHLKGLIEAASDAIFDKPSSQNQKFI